LRGGSSDDVLTKVFCVVEVAARHLDRFVAGFSVADLVDDLFDSIRVTTFFDNNPYTVIYMRAFALDVPASFVNRLKFINALFI